MAPTLSFRSLVPVTLSTLACLIAAGCGGSSTDGTSSTERAKPGGACAPTSQTSQPVPAADGCNTCTCSAGTWACTEKACPAADAGSALGCQPGATRPASDGCNTCSCAGGAWACTERACAPTGTCTNGETKQESCNTCSCTNGAWACTKKACPPAECQSGQTMFDGCNNCSCAGGQWACTQRFCPPAAQDAGTASKGCGARLGDTCGPNEYCAYAEGGLCGAADASATCAPIPEVCDTVYAPVCGCDGKTYANDCTAAMARTGVRQKGTCAVDG